MRLSEPAQLHYSKTHEYCYCKARHRTLTPHPFLPPLPHPCSIEYNVSYLYHALWAYFDRDNVALPGLAAFFKAGSEEEREHAELLMVRGRGRKGGGCYLVGGN